MQAGYSRQKNQLHKKLCQLKTEYDQLRHGHDLESLRKKHYFSFLYELTFKKPHHSHSPTVIESLTPNLNESIREAEGQGLQSDTVASTSNFIRRPNFNSVPNKAEDQGLDSDAVASTSNFFQGPNFNSAPSISNFSPDVSSHGKLPFTDLQRVQKDSSEKLLQDSAKELNGKLKKMWTNPETEDMLKLALENHLFEYKDGDVLRNDAIYTKISSDMQKSGYLRTSSEISNKLASLRADYGKGKERISRSGEAGMKYNLQWRPYWQLMAELFGRRPREKAQGIDSINEEALLDAVITRDKNRDSLKPLKKPPSNALNIMEKSLEKGHEQDKEMLREMMKHEEKLSKENQEVLTQVANTLIGGIKELFQPLLASAQDNGKKKKKSSKKKRKH